MATSTQSQLQTDAETIRVETIPRANTAQRVGQLLRDLVDSFYLALGGKVDAVPGKNLSTNDYSTADERKLSGVAPGATANSPDAQLVNRENHSGTQPVTSITGLAAIATSGSYNDLVNKPGPITFPVAPSTNLSLVAGSTSIELTSSTGLGTTLPAATSANAGLMLPDEKKKIGTLNGINSGDQNIPASSLQILTTDASGVPTLGATMSIQTAWNRLATWAGSLTAVVALTNYTISTVNALLLPADTVNQAFGKLQKQTVDLSTLTGTMATTVGTNTANIAGNATGLAGLTSALSLVTSSVGKKVDLLAGYTLSKNDFTDSLKLKLDQLSSLNASIIRVNETDAPSGTVAVNAGHNATDVWINASTGLIWQLNADRSLYVPRGNSLKGRAGNQWLVGYADDASGTNFTTSPANKKWRAEYLSSSDTETFSAAKATGLWVQFSNNLLIGSHNGTLVDMNVDLQAATDFTGNWTLTDFTNVSLGMTARIKRKSLNTTYVAGTGTATSTSSNYNLVTTSVAHGLIGGDTVRFPGAIVRTVLGNPNNSPTSFILDPALTAPLTNVSYEKLTLDTFVLNPTQVRFTLVGSSTVSNFNNNLIVNQYGVFLEGLTNTLRFECVNVTGIGTAAVAEFDLYITNK